MTKVLTDPIHYKNITDAIREKTGETKNYTPAEMADKILNIEVQYEPFIPDNYIFMEGKGFNQKYVNNSKIKQAYNSVATTNWTVTGFLKDYFYTSNPGNAVLLFTEPFSKNQYSKVYVEAYASGKNGLYNTSSIGLRKYSLVDSTLSNQEPFTKRVFFTYYNNETNYTGTSPWYTMERTVVEIDTSDFPEEFFNIAFHACDCPVRVYNLWLE